VESSASNAPAPTVVAPGAGSAPGDKGLKTGAIGFISSVVIGVASTAPGYSLAAVLGVIVAIEGVGVHAPAVMIFSFVPILFIASAYYYLNRADPDCGTSFSWVTRAMGPSVGWMAGWAIIVADIIVMANLAQIAGLYTFLLFGEESPSTFLVTLLGVGWIAIMAAICVIGIELNARTQIFLLGCEIVTLAIFAAVALGRVYANDAPAGALKPQPDWFNPFSIGSTSALTTGLLVAVFIYWGWDSTVTVNEETENSNETPGRAAVVATLILLGIYTVVSTAAIAFGGPERLANDESGDVLGLLANDVFGSELLGKTVIIAVLTSAAASTQTTILPTARTALSMARAKALPPSLGDIHPRYLTPHVATILMGAFSIIWYVGLTIVSENILFDSIAALGLMIAFYYGLTGFACAIYYRRELTKSVKNFLFIGVAPVLGGATLAYLFVRSCIDLSKPENSTAGDSWLGLGPPLVIGAGSLLLGVVLMVIWRAKGHPEFFSRRREVATTPPGAGTVPEAAGVGTGA
jgi:amino acid transporter